MKTIRHMLVALMALATIGFTACEKENGNNNGTNTGGEAELPAYETLEQTEWEGSYTTTTQTQQGTMQLIIRWTLDFLANGRASVMMVFDSQAFENTPYEWTSTYTYNPTTATGTISDENLGTVNFTVDAVNRTLTAPLVVYVQHDEGAAEIGYGGVTTLHQTH